MAEIDGATLIARTLKTHGIEYAFGIVGVPVTAVALAMQREGIKFIGMRNEQAASYAAGAIGYLTGRPGVCMVVSGPGMTNTVSGMGNATANCWPMLCIAGANRTTEMNMGAFQEAPQLELARPVTKYAVRPDSLARIPYYVSEAVRYALYGRPGCTYLDLTSDLIESHVEEEGLRLYPRVPDPPRARADDAAVEEAMELLQQAQNPLVIIGKGAAYSHAEDELRQFIETTQLPFLASPMGKGVIRDDHPLSVAAARTLALQNADVVLLAGSRMNWIMHFGLPPRYREDVKIIQMDISPEEIGHNVPTAVGLVGDAKAITSQLNDYLAKHPWQYPVETTWRTMLAQKTSENVALAQAGMDDDSVPMGYYRVLREIRDLLPEDAIITNEGAATLDMGRQVLNNYLPRKRLDAGTWGTMGVGLGFAIAAQLVDRTKRVVAVEGDSAFGFSGMEVEVACRHNLPITFIIINNNGVGGGPDELDPENIPPGSYVPRAHYEKVIEAFGGLGFFAETPDEFRSALKQAFDSGKPCVVNVMIGQVQRRQRQFRAFG